MTRLLPLFGLIASGLLSPLVVAEEDEANIDEFVVTATRSRQLVRDQPVRVEVVPEEELAESRTAVPGNLTNLLNELAGARMEAGSAVLGGASLRLRGMPGRHAQILSDGLALSGSQSDAFSFLQTPPVDLGRVEVIKGVASALYGGSALSGVLNLVSRPPGSESELLLSQSSIDSTDADLFLAGRAGAPLGLTFTGSAHRQSRRDRDDDGWAEVPGYRRVTARPRMFWNEGNHSVFATVGFIGEDRTGGTLSSAQLPGRGAFAASLDTRRVDGGMVATTTADGGSVISIRLDGSHTHHDRVFGAASTEDSTTSLGIETLYQTRIGLHDWALGAALRRDELSVPDMPGVSHVYTVPALFAQDEFSPAGWMAISASARVDHHSDFGTFFSPRASALLRLPDNVSIRASLGTGYAPVTPVLDEVEEVGFGALNPLRDLQAERASSASLDLKWKAEPLEVNLSAFASEIRHPLQAEPAVQPGRIDILSASRPFRVHGAELLVGATMDDLHVLVNTTYLDATEAAPAGGGRPAERLPKLTAEVATILEFEGRGRAGVEISYDGAQHLYDDALRTRAPSLLQINALAELRIGRIFVFVNGFNLTDKQQQDYGPLLRPAANPGLGGNPVNPAWASLIGRYFALGFRTEL